MEIETTVEVNPEDVLDAWPVKDILAYTARAKEDKFTEKDALNLFDIIQDKTDINLALVAIKKLDPWDILYYIAKPLMPRNMSDKQSIKNAIMEYLLRL